MIQLGCFDADVSDNACNAYLQKVEHVTRVPMSDVQQGRDKLTFQRYTPDATKPLSVKEVQQALKSIGFFPGGTVDGICGYRTLSAIRLFQEYVRTIEELPCKPDGLCGKETQKHLKRWVDNEIKPDWAPTVAHWKAGTLGQGEYAQWLSLLNKVKQHYMSSPNRMLQLVNSFPRQSDTKKVAEWDFDREHVHLVGIRRSESHGKFDDIIVLLIKGLVFKFQGSTEPGHSTHEDGTPFLVQGQHDYHFGWHKKIYLALRPLHLEHGVLVVRSKGDKVLDDRDLDGGLEANPTINVHWGGKGITFNVSTWSEGCQVINGSLYINHHNKFIDCSSFVAKNNKHITATKTRGAYNVLLDLVTALSSDSGTDTVKYMLLAEQDIDLDPEIKQGLEKARQEAGKFIS